MHEQNTKTTTKPKGEYEKRELRKKEEEIAKREIYAAREKLRRDTAIYGDIFYDWEAIMREREEKLEKEEIERKTRLELSSKLRGTWDLMRICKDFLKERGNEWTDGSENRIVNYRGGINTVDSL